MNESLTNSVKISSSSDSPLKEDFIIYNNKKKSISTNNKTSKCKTIIEFLFPCFKKIDTENKKTIYLSEPEFNFSTCSNKVENHKYNFITFIPLVLFNQFKFFGNQFYLIMTITQFIDVLKVGFLFSYFAPLLIVLVVAMAKELYDDIKRYRQDAKNNNQLYTKISFNKTTNETFSEKIKSMDIKTGDIIEINENEKIPADMILLKAFTEVKSEGASNNVFIRTDQLDGETDWKLRKAPALTQKLSESEIFNLNSAYLIVDPPSKKIYDFTGVMVAFDESNDSMKESLSLENTLWCSTILASKKIIGIVIYTGNETRAKMNSSTPKMKFGVLDLEINKLNKILFIIMVALALLITIVKGFRGTTWYQVLIVFFRFIVLFCGIIPISLRVNLDISKTFFAFQINKDDNIKDTIVRNSTIPEELGRISFVFTDKTGTLTKNEMVFKKIALETDVFSEESFNDLNMILSDECKAYDAPMIDLIKIINDSCSIIEGSVDLRDTEFIRRRTTTSKRIRRNRTRIIRETIAAMAMCNNVTPIINDENEEINYQASSPDEVALVKFAEKLKMRLVMRNDKEIQIKNSNDTIESYEILANFPFSSDTKRMGILLRNKTHGHIIFYLKGAENVIEKFVKDEYKGYIRENAENLACVGLRTLVLTQKLIPEKAYLEWNKRYHEAMTSMENRKENVQNVISELECDMDFLCVTGVEDLLQDDVEQTIENLRNAGMKIWMLTGDKVETATCISISTGIKGKNQKIFFIKSDMINEFPAQERKIQELNNLLDKYKYSETSSNILIIDGDSLELCLNHLEKEFFESAMKAPSVVCCRCSPTQKSRIVKAIKKYTTLRTCAIGDGGNDVAMIQEADVGIGIVGKEGLQASLASDFSIVKFNILNNLLLWWGRIAYKNTSVMCNFIIHRGLIISLIQFIFSLMFYCNAVALYNGMLILGYSTIYTCFPAISLLLDNDTERGNVVKFPRLYKILLYGRELSTKQFLWWFFKSIFQASVIMICSMYFFTDSIYLKIVTVTFSELIIAELLNVYTEIHKFHWFMGVSLAGTFAVYLFTLFFFDNILDVYFIFDIKTFGIIFGITLISWAPFYIISFVRAKCFPEAHEKLNEISNL